MKLEEQIRVAIRTARPSAALVSFVIVLLLLTTAVGLRTFGGAARPMVNINTASEGQLTFLPYVDSDVADRIVRDRERYGAYPTVDHLGRLQKIIGRERLGCVRRYITLGGETTANRKIPRCGR